MEPCYSLKECLFLGESFHLDIGPSADSEAVGDAREQGDLVGVTSLLQNLLRPVTLLGGEDGIGFRGRNRERTCDGREFLFFNKGWVGNIANIDSVLVVTNKVLVPRSQVSIDGHVMKRVCCAFTNLGAKAISYSTHALNSVLFPQSLDRGDDDRIHSFLRVWVLAVRAMVEPSCEIEVGGPVQIQRIAIELVDYKSKVAVGSELISQELGVLPDTYNVGAKEDALAWPGVVGRGSSEIGVPFPSNLDKLADGLSALSIIG